MNRCSGARAAAAEHLGDQTAYRMGRPRAASLPSPAEHRAGRGVFSFYDTPLGLHQACSMSEGHSGTLDSASGQLRGEQERPFRSLSKAQRLVLIARAGERTRSSGP